MLFINQEQQSGPYRLGRHVLHDDASKDFEARKLVGRRPRPLRSVQHTISADIWDQGDIGQCTAEAAFGSIMFDQIKKPDWNFNGTGVDSDTLALYREETRLDDSQIAGSWEPEDTGSTGVWSMKALHKRGLIKEYRWAFSLTTVLQLLLDQPVSTGTAWYDSMFYPDSDGRIKVDDAQQAAGGHQYLLIGMDMETEEVIGRNSWGSSWGVGGLFRITFADYGKLLADNGDAVVPVV